ADAGNDAGRGHVAAVHLISGERRKLEQRRVGIDEPPDALAGDELAARDMPLLRLLAAALPHRVKLAAQIIDQTFHRVGITRERARPYVKRRGKWRHCQRALS